MIRNYLLTILRQLRKDKDFSVINIMGLAIGMVACLVIVQFVHFHQSFDEYHPDSDRIFRVHPQVIKSGQETEIGNKISNPLGEALQRTLPEVQETARFYGYNYANSSVIVKTEKGVINFDQEGIYATNTGTFSVFSLPLAAGSIAGFDAPMKAVMTRTNAARFFESPEDAIGSTFQLSGNNGVEEFELVAIMEDLPPHTHLDFQLLISMASLEKYTASYQNWTAYDFFTYVKLARPTDQPEVLAALARLTEQNAAARLKEYGYEMDYSLVALEDIHLYSQATGDFKPPMDYRVIYALAIIAAFILIIAWINYLNLSLVKTLERLKEVGIRKALGSTTRQINLLFITEAILLNTLAFVVALTIGQLISPWVERLTDLPFDAFSHPEITLLLFAIVLIGSLAIGLYPAVASNTILLTRILLGGKAQKLGGVALRQILVSLQFVVTFLLVCGTLVVYQQIRYMKTAELGFDKNHVMVVKSPPGDVKEQNREDIVAYNSFRTELLKKPGIKMVTNAGEIPGQPVDWQTSIKLPSMSNEERIPTALISMGLDFPDFLGLEVVAGRGLVQGDDPWSKGDVIINEKLAEALGFETPEAAIGANLEGFYAPIEVRGVVKNHHHTSLHDDFRPSIFILSSWTEYYFIKFDINDQLTVRERSARYQQLVAEVEQQWDEAFPYNMDYFFLDEYFNVQYREDERFGQLFSTFSVLAIFIACLGLFGLTSFTLKQRTKEIGIRKVLGARASDLVFLLSKNYLAIIVISYLMAMPLAWLLLQQWLQGYTFRIELGAWALAAPLLVVLTVAGATILTKMLETARRNPVESLRYE